MALIIRRAGDVDSKDLFYKALVYADAGFGKTWLAAECETPFVILTERNGEQTIRHANPDALYAIVETADDFRDAMAMAMSGELTAKGVKTLCIDGLTEIQRLFKDEMLAERGDGMFSVGDWGDLNEKMRLLLRTIRALKMDVFCTALAESEKEEGAGVIHYQPSFQGKKLANEVMQFFNFVGYGFKGTAEKGGDPKRNVMIDGPSRIKCKPCIPLRGVIVGPARDWFTTLRAPVAAPVGRSVSESDVKAIDAAPPPADAAEKAAAEKAETEKNKRGRAGKKPDAKPEVKPQTTTKPGSGRLSRKKTASQTTTP